MMNFLEIVDDIFLIEKEMVADKGEDNYYCSMETQAAMISVFDGCGGLGTKRYERFGGRKGAYMASRLVSGAVHDWFNSNATKHWSNSDELILSINSYIASAFSVCKEYAKDTSLIRGSLVRDFPTTAVMVLLQPEKDGVIAHIMWAGDSRAYLLDKDGLAQLTIDDVDNTDAMDNLKNDGALNNLLSADGKYKINYKKVYIDKPVTLFVATDGCFGYIASPMEFEYLILKNIIESRTPELLCNNLKMDIAEYTGDDFALGAVSMFYGDYKNMQQELLGRMRFIETQYIKPLCDNHSDENAYALWRKYKPNYERYM